MPIKPTKKKVVKKPTKKAVKKRAVKAPKKPIKSKIKKAIVKRAKKAEKLPAYMTDKSALKHYRFALKYIELELNATQAYLAVYGEGYFNDKGKEMPKSLANTSSCRLLVNAKVQGYVQELIEELLLEDKSNAKKILARYNRWADSDIGEYIDIKKVKLVDADGNSYDAVVPDMKTMKELTVEQRKNIKSLTFKDGGVKFELVDKKGSNDQLAKIAGLDKGSDVGEREIHLHFDKLDEQL